MGGLGRLAPWHLPDGPVGRPSRWSATLNVEVGQTTFPVYRDRVVMEGRAWSQGQSHKEQEREGGKGTVEETQGPLAEGEDSIWIVL